MADIAGNLVELVVTGQTDGMAESTSALLVHVNGNFFATASGGGGGGGGAAAKRFLMRGRRTGTTTYDVWQVLDAPDLTASQYSGGFTLVDIVIAGST